jgi:hypothetical protein
MLQHILRLYSTTIDFREFIFHLAITALLCFGVGLIYVAVARRPNKALRLARIFPALGMGMALATIVLGSSLAIAIGLVGAISVVRYRAVLQDIEQLSFILLTVAVGLGSGSGQLMLVAVALPLVGSLLMLQRYLQRHHQSRYSLHLSGDPADLQALLPRLKNEFPGLRLRHAHVKGTAAEWRFSLSRPRSGDALALFEQLAGTPGVRISLREDQDA